MLVTVFFLSIRLILWTRFKCLRATKDTVSSPPRPPIYRVLIFCLFFFITRLGSEY